MPIIKKKVYERYHDKGFEIVGVCFEDDKLKPKINALMKKMDIPWVQAMGGRWGPLCKKYGFTGVPQWFLLDQSGRLVSARVSDTRSLGTEISRLLQINE